jgi:hypothetical protein
VNPPDNRSEASRGPSRRSAPKVVGAAGFAAAASPFFSVTSAAAATTTQPLSVNWNNVARVSKTTPTLQVVVNPLIRPESPIHDNVFAELSALQADFVRFVPWFPYPRLGVAELEAPSGGTTSWDFSLIDPMVEDFEKATRGHSTILNFSTTPEWMWEPRPWIISDGRLLVTGGPNGLSNAGSSWTDYTFTADVTPLRTGVHGSSTYAQAGLLVRMDDTFDGYGFLLSNYPYSSPAASGYIVFVNFSAGGVTALNAAELPFAVTGATMYHVEITVSGATLTVSVNGATVYTINDSTWAEGKVGFREANPESAYFANVKVTAPDGTVLLSDDFSDGLSQWNPPQRGALTSDPNAIDFSYSGGSTLQVPVEMVADYYRRVVSWYTAGGFVDEYGKFHESQHHYDLPYWEVLNEMEHGLSPQLYTQLYDAIVTAIREVSPQTKFVGLALGNAAQLDYFRYFLDRANHAPGVPLDMISYHYYARASGADTVDTYGPNTFPGADSFIATVAEIESIREQLAPQVRTTIDELGTILTSAATQLNPAPIPDGYWNYSGAIYAYVFANLALQGIDVIGESQFVGYPGQYPSVSMVDWNTGLPNARYRVLQLMLEEMRPGCKLVPVASGVVPDQFYALGIRGGNELKILLVNKTNSDVTIQLAGITGGKARVVDQTSAGGPIRTDPLQDDTYTLGGYAVAFVVLPEQ